MEIGSEYWLEKQLKNRQKNNIECENEILLMSGRTAIDYALEIITTKRKINTVYFPSYCCQSMIEPFLNRNITVVFYNVSFENGKFIYDIDNNKKCDIFFAMNYFGYSDSNMDYYIKKFKNRGIIVIEDSTHSLFSERKYSKNSDFIIASLRKWFPIISGGKLIVQSEEFELNKNINLKENYEYINIKKIAMKEKYKYIEKKEEIEKNEFLRKFHKSEEILDIDYKKYKIDNTSYDILKNINLEEVIKRRKENVKIIYDFLRKQTFIRYIENIDFEKDCLLFVPIFLDNLTRNKLKKYLIKNDVYCPNHWPIPNILFEDRDKKIYDTELSLICDQRYKVENIKSYIRLINEVI